MKRLPHRAKRFSGLGTGLALAVLVANLLSAWTPGPHAYQAVNRAALAKPFSHALWDRVLATHVSARGLVDFGAVKAQPRSLNRYLAQLADMSPQSHPDWFPTWRHRLAYWLNAHNALLLRAVLDAYPVESLAPLRRSGALLRPAYPLGGAYHSVAQVAEHVQRDFSFRPDAPLGLSGLTLGSPTLPQAAYTADNLDALLGRQADRLPPSGAPGGDRLADAFPIAPAATPNGSSP